MADFDLFDSDTQQTTGYKSVPKGYGKWCEKIAENGYPNPYYKEGKNLPKYNVPIDGLIAFLEKELRSRNKGKIKAK